MASLAAAARFLGDDPLAMVRAALAGVELAAREVGGGKEHPDFQRAVRAVADGVLERWKARSRRVRRRGTRGARA